MEEKFAEWKFEKKQEAYQLLLNGELDHGQYRNRLAEIDMISL